MLGYVQRVPDPRKARGKRYRWEFLLGVILAGLASGQKTAWTIAQWAKPHGGELCRELKSHCMASAATIYRALRYLDIEALEREVAAYGRAMAEGKEKEAGTEGRGAIVTQEGQALRGQAIDGKELRGAYAHGSRIHLLSAVRHAQATVLGQLRVADKSSEVSALPQLLKGLDLRGTVSTFDALFTRRPVARQIIAQEGHYLMIVKRNQPTLWEALQTLFQSPSLPWGEEELQLLQCRPWAFGATHLGQQYATERVPGLARPGPGAATYLPANNQEECPPQPNGVVCHHRSKA